MLPQSIWVARATPIVAFLAICCRADQLYDRRRLQLTPDAPLEGLKEFFNDSVQELLDQEESVQAELPSCAWSFNASCPAFVLGAFVVGKLRMDQCPNGTSPIRDVDACSQAQAVAGFAGLTLDDGQHGVCHWCGGCVPQHFKVSPTRRGRTKWICQAKDDESPAGVEGVEALGKNGSASANDSEKRLPVIADTYGALEKNVSASANSTENRLPVIVDTLGAFEKNVPASANSTENHLQGRMDALEALGQNGSVSANGKAAFEAVTGPPDAAEPLPAGHEFRAGRGVESPSPSRYEAATPHGFSHDDMAAVAAAAAAAAAAAVRETLGVTAAPSGALNPMGLSATAAQSRPRLSLSWSDSCSNEAQLNLSRLIQPGFSAGGSAGAAVYGNVFPASGRIVDMEVRNESSYQPCGSVLPRDARLGHATLCVEGGSSVALNFLFKDRATGETIDVSQLYISFFGLQTAPSGQGAAEVHVPDFLHANRSAHTSVKKIADHVFRATSFPSNADALNPSSLWTEDDVFSVSFLFPKGHGFNATFAVADGPGQHFEFGGAAGFMCPRGASCGSVSCGDGLFGDESKTCQASTCVDVDLGWCCAEKLSVLKATQLAQQHCNRSSTLRLITPLHSNLGGLGPHHNANMSILFGDVFPYSDHAVDMEVTNETEFPAGTGSSNFDGSSYGIPLAPSSRVRLKFRFLSRETKQPVAVPPFALAFSGSTTRSSKKGSLRIHVSDYKYYVNGKREPPDGAESSQVDNVDIADGVHRFLLTGAPQFVVTAGLPTESDALTSLRFSGVSPTDCTQSLHRKQEALPAARVQDQAPADESSNNLQGIRYDQRGEDETSKQTAVETTQRSEIRVNTTSKGCAVAEVLSLNKIAHSNLGGLGPDVTSRRSILYIDVFPMSGRRVDLELTNLTQYSPGDPSLNGLNPSQTGIISVAAGSKVQLRFKFITINPVGDFWLTFFDVDQGLMDRSVLQLEVPSHVSHAVMNEGSIWARSGPFFEAGLQSNSSGGSYLTLHDRRSAISFLMPGSFGFTAHLGVIAGFSSRSFMFGGQSEVACPQRGSCANFQCPAGLSKVAGLCAGAKCKPSDSDLCCRRDHLDADDSQATKIEETSACANKNRLQLNKLIVSNLGNSGPDRNKAPKLLFGDVFPDGERIVDLSITNESEYHYNPSLTNDIRNGHAALTLAPGTWVLLRFAFTDRVSRSRAKLPPYFLTISDIDMDSAGPLAEGFRISGYEHAFVGNSTLIKLSGGGRFGAIPNVQKIQGNMSDVEERLSVTFLMRREASFVVNFTTAPKCNGKHFRLGGARSFVCPAAPGGFCETFQCPIGWRKVGSEKARCVGDVCTEADVPNCCTPSSQQGAQMFMTGQTAVTAPEASGEQAARSGCQAVSGLSFARMKHSNLGGLGPDVFAPSSIVYTNVFPHSGKQVDLEIINKTLYRARSPEKNIKSASGGRISVESNTSVVLAFKFSEPPPQHFWLSFLAMRGSRSGDCRERVRIPSSSAHKVSSSTAVEIKGNGFFEVASYNANLSDVPDAGNLSAVDKMYSISLLLHQRQFDVELSTNGKMPDRTYSFTGQSSLSCPAATCRSFDCPVGFVRKPAEDQECSGSECDFQDVDLCCDKDPEATPSAGWNPDSSSSRLAPGEVGSNEDIDPAVSLRNANFFRNWLSFGPSRRF